MEIYKNKVDSMKKIAVGLGICISTLGFAPSCTMEIENHRVADSVTRAVAGEDRMTDYNETRKALDVLGYKNIVLNDRERIYFSANGFSDAIQVSVGTQAPIPAFQDNRFVGSIQREKLEKIILNAFGEKKNDN